MKSAHKLEVFERRRRRYEAKPNTLLVLETLVEARRLDLPIPEWVLDEQARINQEILQIGFEHKQHANLASAICQAIGLTGPGRGNAFSRAERESLMCFLDFVMEKDREAVAKVTGAEPSWTETYAEFVDCVTGGDPISERTLRRARKHVEELRRNGFSGPSSGNDET